MDSNQESQKDPRKTKKNPQMQNTDCRMEVFQPNYTYSWHQNYNFICKYTGLIATP